MLKTVIIAPMISKGFEAPTRISFKFNKTDSLIILDQIRAIDKKRLVEKLGAINYITQNKIINVLIEMFS